MGLLDMGDEGLLGLSLMAAGAPRERRMGLGEGLLGAIQGVRANRAAEEERKARQQMQAMQMQQQQMQMQAMQEQQRRAQTQEQYINSLPMPEGLDPNSPQAMLYGAMKARLVDPLQYLQSQQPKADDFTALSPGQVLYNKTKGQEVFRAPDKPAEAPADYRLWELSGAKERGIPFDQWDLVRRRAGAANTQVSYGAPMAGVDAQGRPVFFQPDRQGGAPAIVPGVTPPKPDRPLTEAQAKAAAFGSQMRAASKELGESGYDPNSIGAQVEVNVAGGLGNLVAGPAAQRARQSQEQWAEAVLRFKTGAASTEDEVRRNVRTYFPQPGDTAAVIAQKQRMRQQAERDVGLAAGGVAQNVIDFGSLQ